MPSGGGINMQEILISLGVNADWTNLNKVINFLNSGTVKTAAFGTALVAAGKAVYNFIKTNTELEQSFEKLAKKQNKTVETVRAEQNALKAMGKTASEVNNDASLKKIYDDIVKVNKSLALPNMDAALSNINQLQSAFYELRSVMSYAAQWINYHLLANLEEPIQRITSYIKEISSYIQNNINTFAMKVSSVITAFSKGLIGIVETGAKIIKWVEQLPTGIKTATVALAAMITLLKTGPLGQIFTMITMIGGLIDDYENFQWNKSAAEGDKVDVAFGGIWELLDMDDKTIGEKASGIGELLISKFSEAVEGNGLALGAVGGTLIASIFGGDALSKLILFLAGAVGAALLDPTVQDAVAEFASNLWQSIVDAMPDWLRDFFGLQSSTEKEAADSIDKPLYFDENGNAVTEWEYQNSSDERKTQLEGNVPTEEQAAFQQTYSDFTNKSGLNLRQSAGDLYPSLVAPDGTGMTAANTPAIQQWNTLFQQAMQTQNSTLLKNLETIGQAWQNGVSAEDTTAVGRQAYSETMSHQLSQLSALLSAGLPYLGSDYDMMDGRLTASGTYSRLNGNLELQSLMDARTANINTDSFKQSLSDALSGTGDLTWTTGEPTVPSDAGTTVIEDVQEQIDKSSKTVKVNVEGKNNVTAQNAWGGRYDRPITTEVAEDGGTEYIIPLNKPARAFSLIKQMLGEMGSAATSQLMQDLGLGVAGTVGSSAASISAMSGGASIANSYNISAPVTIQVTANGADAKAIGTAAYSAAERQLIRSLKGVLA